MGVPHLNERENKKYHWLAVQPLNRKAIFLCDYIEFMSISFLYYVCLLFFSFLIAKLFGGTSSWDYPLLSYDLKNYRYTIIPVWRYLLLVSSLFFLNLSFFYFLAQFIFTFIRKSLASFVIVVCVLGVFFVEMTANYPEQLNQVIAYQPSVYFNPSQIVIGTSYEKKSEIIEFDQTNFNSDYMISTGIFYTENVSYYLGNTFQKQTNNNEIDYVKGLISLGVVNSCLFIGNLTTFNKRMCG